MTPNEKLKELGFELKHYDEESGCWTYENIKDDQRVDISYDTEDWYIISETISKDEFWNTMPVGFRYDELKAFMELIDELKGEYQ